MRAARCAVQQSGPHARRRYERLGLRFMPGANDDGHGAGNLDSSRRNRNRRVGGEESDSVTEWFED